MTAQQVAAHNMTLHAVSLSENADSYLTAEQCRNLSSRSDQSVGVTQLEVSCGLLQSQNSNWLHETPHTHWPQR